MNDDRQTARQGLVSLVGAGPGDPDLVTLRGLRAIEEADVIFYDNLAPYALLTHAPQGAETNYVGRKRAEHACSQQEIHRLLIESARSGKRVVRLKGGDPFVFGRGGEEAEALAEAGVRFEVIPGVTSALGVGAYAGIPLTHRDWTSTATFVTGHDVDAIDWSQLGRVETLVIFMGLTAFGRIALRLIENGRLPETPAAAVRWGTRGDQTVVEGTIANLAAEIQRARLNPPALIVVGEVISLRPRLNWFEKLPLFGLGVVVTRARGPSGDPFRSALRSLGAHVIDLPTIETEPVSDDGLDHAIADLVRYDWLIFTSANGVRYFMERLDRSKRDLRDLRARICAIGPATADAVQAFHLKVDLLPRQFVAEGVLAAFEPHDLHGKHVLLPRAAQARDVLPLELEKRGAIVHVAPAYRTVLPAASQTAARRVFSAAKKPDWITFTSSSTAKNFASMVPADRLQGARVASIGPITSATLRELGLRVDVEAREYTTEGLIQVLVENRGDKACEPIRSGIVNS